MHRSTCLGPGLEDVESSASLFCVLTQVFHVSIIRNIRKTWLLDVIGQCG